MIVKRENKWLVMDSSGKKVLGTHYSKEEAKDQLAAIEISKKRRSVEESSNLLNNSMTNLTNYYRNICEQLKDQIVILEKKVKEEKQKKGHSKSDKKADKDYDGDGKVESGSDEYLGSRSNAIKKAIAKREGKELKESYLTEANLGSESGRRAYREKRLRDSEKLYGDSKKMPGPRFNLYDGPFRVGGGGGYKFYGPGRENPDESDMNYLPTADEMKYIRDQAAKGLDPSGRPLKTKTETETKTPESKPDDTLDSLRSKARDIGGVPLPEPQDDIDRLRAKGRNIGGVEPPADIAQKPRIGSQRTTDVFAGTASGSKASLGKVSPKIEPTKAGGNFSPLSSSSNTTMSLADTATAASLPPNLKRFDMRTAANDFLNTIRRGPRLFENAENQNIQEALKAISGNNTLSSPSVRYNGVNEKSYLVDAVVNKLNNGTKFEKQG